MEACASLDAHCNLRLDSLVDDSVVHSFIRLSQRSVESCLRLPCLPLYDAAAVCPEWSDAPCVARTVQYRHTCHPVTGMSFVGFGYPFMTLPSLALSVDSMPSFLSTIVSHQGPHHGTRRIHSLIQHTTTCDKSVEHLFNQLFLSLLIF